MDNLNLLSSVREIKEVRDINLVNSLIQRDWILLRIISNQDKTIFILGKIHHDIGRQQDRYHDEGNPVSLNNDHK